MGKRKYLYYRIIREKIYQKEEDVYLGDKLGSAQNDEKIENLRVNSEFKQEK